jgi:hypothetical protein
MHSLLIFTSESRSGVLRMIFSCAAQMARRWLVGSDVGVEVEVGYARQEKKTIRVQSPPFFPIGSLLVHSYQFRV